MSATRRYIVEIPTGRYWTETGHWTELIEKAWVLPDFRTVLQTCRVHQLEHIELLIRSENGLNELRIKL